MSRAVVIGSGSMGAGIAAIFVAHGHDAIVLGRDPAKVEARFPRIREIASSIDARGNAVDGTLIAGSIDAWSDFADTLLVIETVTETLSLKQALFASLDARVPPDVPIGTNSSGFGIDEIAGDLPTASRMLNVHYSMPADMVPMVEVALGSRTDPAIGDRVCALLAATGKKSSLIRKYIPGLLISRLQHAMMREALSLVDQGVVTRQDIDDAVRFGFGFRYAAAGPIAQKEMSGWDTHAFSAATVYPTLSNVTTPPKCVTDLVEAGRTGMSSGAGFDEWTPGEAAEFRRRYGERLRAAFAVLGVAPD